MKSSNLNKNNAYIWSSFSPVVKRMTRKGKVIFTAIDGNGEGIYVSTGTFASADDFYESVYSRKEEEK